MFRKTNRVHSNEFEHFFMSGKRFHVPNFELRYTPHDTLKVAVVVPKKVLKGAVGRNRLRRQISHFLRALLEGRTGVYLFVVKRGAQTNFGPEAQADLETLLSKV